MAVDAKVSGLDNLRARCDAVAKGITAELEEALEAEARELADDERARVHRVTGELHDSIDARRTGEQTFTVQPWDPATWWAVFLEWGRSNADPVPFATPSAELARRRWPKRARSAVAAGVRRR